MPPVRSTQAASFLNRKRIEDYVTTLPAIPNGAFTTSTGLWVGCNSLWEGLLRYSPSLHFSRALR